MSDLVAVESRAMTGEPDIAALMPVPETGDGFSTHDLTRDAWFLAEWHRRNAPLRGPRSYDDGRWSAVFAGDLIDHSEVPFPEIVAALADDRCEMLAELEGIFAIAAYDRETRRFFAVSDRRSQKPLFYRHDESGISVSTSLATFVRLSGEVAFNKQWLWEMLFFNFPVRESTFLEGVVRFPPACVMTYDERAGRLSKRYYANQFDRMPQLIQGQEALRWATDVFMERVAAHYGGLTDVACALTGGWDGRTVLALAPNVGAVTAYTYGGPGCGDLLGAKDTAEAVDVNHIQIPFNDTFVDRLPYHALETVYQSSGLQGVLRSTLHFMYETLTDGGRRFPLTVSGISLGTQIRGHAQFPDLVSAELARRFQGLGPEADNAHWRTIVGDDEPAFSEHIDRRLDQLRDQFGPFESPAHHLSYTIYPLSTHHFCGELAVADRYTTVRVPAWDSRVIELLFSIEFSMLTFSQFTGKSHAVRRREMILQATLLRDVAPAFYGVPVRGIHPQSVLAGELSYQFERAYRAAQKRFRLGPAQFKYQPLEDWKTWLFEGNREFLASLLLSTETLVTGVVEPAFVQRAIETRDMRLVGKLMTAEVVLRLIKNRWQRFW